MWTIKTLVQRTLLGLSAAFLSQTTPLHAAIVHRTRQIADRPAAHRFEVMVSPAQAIAGGRFARTAVLNRVRAQLVDSTGRPAMPVTWEVIVRVASRGTGWDGPLLQLAHLNGLVTTVDYPRPWGNRVTAADSVIVTVQFADSVVVQSRQLSVQVFFEYDPTDRPSTRLAVISRIGEEQEPESTRRVWEWTADSTGNIHALIGAALKTARDLVLLDVTTGAVLWHERGGSYGAGSTFGQPTGVARPGVHVQVGQRYRLIAEYDATVSGRAGSGGVLALLLPSRVTTP